MKKSVLFTAGIAIIAALFCVTCEDNSGRSPGDDEDAYSFANKFRGGDPCVANPAAQGCSDNCPPTQPNCPGYVTPTTYFTLTVTRNPTDGGSTTPASSQSNISAGTPVNITATPASTYNFNNWTVTSGTATFANANNVATTVTLSSNTTIRANFTVTEYYCVFEDDVGCVKEDKLNDCGQWGNGLFTSLSECQASWKSRGN